MVYMIQKIFKIKLSLIDKILVILSVLLFTYAIYLALTHSYTHDESFTFLVHRTLGIKDILLNNGPAPANNHIFNTLLIKLFAKILGKTQLIGRLPSLLSFGLYLISVFLIFRKSKWYLRIFGFFCLTMNPFLIEFFTLSRGYGLSIGIFLFSIYLFLRYWERRNILLGSLALWVGGFSVWSSFVMLTFYIPIGLIMIFLCLEKSINEGGSKKFFQILRRMMLNTWQVVTPLLFWVAITIYPVIKLQTSGSLYYGGTSGFWKDTVLTLINSSLYLIDESAFIIKIIQLFVFAMFILTIFLSCGLLFKYKSNLRVKLLLGLLLLGISFNISQHIVLDSKFLIDRTALIYIPIFALCVTFCIEHLIENFGVGYRILGLILFASISVFLYLQFL